MAEFLDMGGYAAYIWPAYGIAAGVIVGLFVWTRHGLKKAEQAEEALGRRQRRRTPKVKRA
jgi:heme exporter protein D